MSLPTAFYAAELRHELIRRNQTYARGRAHVESYGSAPVIVYAPEAGIATESSSPVGRQGERHGNFFDPAYAAILEQPDWLRRFDKVHAQAARSLPTPLHVPGRRWRELDSSMSSDALLMNIFCTPGVLDSPALLNTLGIESHADAVFGWKARVPLSNGRFDRTEVDMRLGSLLLEAKLTESDFQCRAERIVESYRDFDQVFDRELLPRAEIAIARPRRASEFPENVSQEFESEICDPGAVSVIDPAFRPAGESGYASYQLIRNVLAAYANEASFCVIHDERRPDLREHWFQVMAAVKSATLRVRLKVLTWQELAALLPAALQDFLDIKYGIVPPGKMATPIDE